MKKNGSIPFLLKIAALLIINVVTLLLVFSVWLLLNLAIFPWALASILISLVLLDAVVLVLPFVSDRLGPTASYPLVISTVIYYLATLLFTWVSYPSISSKWYIICSLLLLLLYIGFVTVICHSSIGKAVDIDRQENEQARSLDVRLLVLTLGDNLKKQDAKLSPTDLKTVQAAYLSMKERLDASTPFGRITAPVVVDVENKICTMLCELNASLTIPEGPDAAKIASRLEEIRVLIMNKEKLLIH